MVFRIFLLGTLATVVCYGILVLVNLNDDPLSPEAKDFKVAATLVVPAEKNGYFAALGWRTAAKNDPYVTGWWLFEGRKDFAAHNVLTHDFLDVLSVPDLAHLCDRKHANCLEKVSRELGAIHKIVTDHAFLLSRIRNLNNYPYFYTPRLVMQDPWRPNRLFEYCLLWKIGATVSAHAWKTENFQEAISTIAARITVARRMLRDSGSILDKALAVGWLRSDIF